MNDFALAGGPIFGMENPIFAKPNLKGKTCIFIAGASCPEYNGKKGISMENAKRNGLLVDDGVRLMRIREKPVGTDGLLVDDRLESEGCLRIYEHAGGAAYLFMEPSQMDNLVLVAEIRIAASDKGAARVSGIFYEYGHENLVPVMVEQARHFAEFYGYEIVFLDLKKEPARV